MLCYKVVNVEVEGTGRHIFDNTSAGRLRLGIMSLCFHQAASFASFTHNAAASKMD